LLENAQLFLLARSARLMVAKWIGGSRVLVHQKLFIFARGLTGVTYLV
jgi:hypothetical protein